MFLRCKVRRKDGKQHRYWSVVENTRTARGRVVQRQGSTQLDPLDFAFGESRLRVTSSGLIMSRLGQVSLTKPTYRRIILRCCSVPQAKPSPDYEYRISLRLHPVGHPSSRHTGFCKQGGPVLDTN